MYNWLCTTKWKVSCYKFLLSFRTQLKRLKYENQLIYTFRNDLIIKIFRKDLRWCLETILVKLRIFWENQGIFPICLECQFLFIIQIILISIQWYCGRSVQSENGRSRIRKKTGVEYYQRLVCINWYNFTPHVTVS